MDVPARITLDNRGRHLILEWPDGRRVVASYASLRAACPCSSCRRIRLDGATVSASPDVEVVEVASMGYGAQLIFSDGHERGIFPWAWLIEFWVGIDRKI